MNRSLPPFIYGREAGPNERVWTEQAVRLYGEACASLEPQELVAREFANELGNRIKITIEGPTSTSENILTPMEVTELRAALNGAVEPAYSEMSREALERHAARMAQMLADDKPRRFYERYATGPKLMPSCVCCGELPGSVGVQHMELPGIVVCTSCREAASQRLTAAVAQGMEAEGRDACGSGPQGRQPGAAERHAPNNRSPGSAPTGEALTDEQEREAFEAWAKREGVDTTLWMEHTPKAGWLNGRTADYWTGWLARAALATHPTPAQAAPQATAGVAPTLTDELRAAAQAVIDRWETPLWKDAPATAGFIYRLRDALAATRAEPAAKPVAPQMPFSPTQRKRLWLNSPDVQGDARSFAGFARILVLVEQAHGITATPALDAMEATRAEPSGGRDELAEFQRWADTIGGRAACSGRELLLCWTAWQARASLAAPPSQQPQEKP